MQCRGVCDPVCPAGYGHISSKLWIPLQAYLCREWWILLLWFLCKWFPSSADSEFGSVYVLYPQLVLAFPVLLLYFFSIFLTWMLEKFAHWKWTVSCAHPHTYTHRCTSELYTLSTVWLVYVVWCISYWYLVTVMCDHFSSEVEDLGFIGNLTLGLLVIDLCISSKEILHLCCVILLFFWCSFQLMLLFDSKQFITAYRRCLPFICM